MGTRSREMVIRIQLGNAEMSTGADVSWLLNQMRKALVEANDIEDIPSSFKDVNGTSVARVEFDPRYAPCRVFMRHQSLELTAEEVEAQFARVVSDDNFCDLAIETETDSQGSGMVEAEYTVDVDRHFLEVHKGHFKFESPYLQFEIKQD